MLTSPILSAIFFVSGAAALLFETLWFQQAGLAFGNSVWASAMVLASFMAGLALGNGIVLRLGARIERPVRLYALLEVAIAATGFALVLLLPLLGSAMAPWLGTLSESPWFLNASRLGVGFGLLLVPATAMGATLPLLVKAMHRHDTNFGSTLGRLYGWNTLGAVVGALAGEFVLFAAVGIRGSAAVAAGLNLAACLAAWTVSARTETRSTARSETLIPESVEPLSPASKRLLLATFLAGGLLLALEVVWFRLLLPFVSGTGPTFAMLLATVLVAIGMGGRLAGAWLSLRPEDDVGASALAFVGGLSVVVLYAAFPSVVEVYGSRQVSSPGHVLAITMALVFPVAFFSGVLFTLTGTALRRRVSPATRAAGWLTLANTVGSSLGSLLAGFVLLPGLGVERSLFWLSLGYLGVGGLLASGIFLETARRVRRAKAAAAVAAIALVISLFLFPAGLMEKTFVQRIATRYGSPQDLRIAAVREGRSGNLIYLQETLLGEPLFTRIVTDGFSMAGNKAFSQRYMKLYVAWPIALRPNPRSALLISYGAGSTARAMTDTRSLEHIDVVDTSRDILELSAVVHGADDPLLDPRVRVHVEDGRYFLQSTDRHYDLITGEPPPPRLAGVWSLYTREYFQLIYDRLAAGGINTYWLPVHDLSPASTLAIVRAYCDVFSDCSLWNGKWADWMLVGSREADWPRDAEGFAAQWSDPEVFPELERIGLENPAQLGATFLADADQLREWTRNAAPLVDDFPSRLESARDPVHVVWRFYRDWTDTAKARKAFEKSPFIRSSFPDTWRKASLGAFENQRQLNDLLVRKFETAEILPDLHAIQSGTDLRTLALWRLGYTTDEAEALERMNARGENTEALLGLRAALALSERDYETARVLYEKLRGSTPATTKALFLQAYATAMSGREQEANALLSSQRAHLGQDADSRRVLHWFAETFKNPQPPSHSVTPGPADPGA